MAGIHLLVFFSVARCADGVLWGGTVQAAAAQVFSANVNFKADESGIVVSLRRDVSVRATELYWAIIRRQCVKAAYDGTPLETAGKSQNVRTIILLSQAQKEAVIDDVTRGDVDQLTDPAFRDELVSRIRFNPAAAIRRGDGLYGRTSGQPALPTWLAKRIIGLVLTPKGQAETNATNIRSSAGVAVFVSRGNDKAAWMEAGRTYQRFALRATALAALWTMPPFWAPYVYALLFVLVALSQLSQRVRYGHTSGTSSVANFIVIIVVAGLGLLVGYLSYQAVQGRVLPAEGAVNIVSPFAPGHYLVAHGDAAERRTVMADYRWAVYGA